MKTKPALLLVLLSFLCSPVMSQTFYLGGGANLSLAKSDALDFVIQRYNETRTECNVFCLSDEMENFRNISGTCFGLGYVSESGFMYDFTWSGRNDLISAQGTPPAGELSQRDVKIRANTFDIGLGYALPQGGIRPGLMFSVDVGSTKTFTRVDLESTIKDVDFEEVTNDLSLGFTLSGNLFFLLGDEGGIGLLLRPYYQFAAFENDYYDLNAAINSATYINDDYEVQKGRISNYGIKVMLILGIWDY